MSFRELRWLLLLLIIVGCSKFTASELPTLKPKELPITEVVQSLNLTADRLWDTAQDILAARRIAVSEADEENGRITSDWVNIMDKTCGAEDPLLNPLSCRVRFMVQLQPITPKASSFTIRYQEQCLEHEEFNLECPGSNAEKLMISIVDDLKREAGVID